MTNTKQLTKTRKSGDAAGQAGEQALDPFLAAHALEHQAEGARAEQDEHHHGGDAHGRLHALIDQCPAEAAIEPGEREGADDAHGAGLGGRGEAHENGAENDEDERQRRHHGPEAEQWPAPQPRRVRASRGSAGTWAAAPG